MEQQSPRLNREECIEFILSNFKSSQDLANTLSKYRGGQRYTNLPEIDKVIFNNIIALSSIASEIQSGALDLFGNGLSIDDLKFWVNKNYPTKEKLDGLIDLYTNDGSLDNLNHDLIVRHNFDKLIDIYNQLYVENDDDLKETIELEKPTIEDNLEDTSLRSIKENEIKSGIKTFAVEEFDEEPEDSNQLLIILGSLQTLAFNAKEMHWNVRGPGFKGLHEILGEIYDKMDGYVDELVETMMSNNVEFNSRILSFISYSELIEYNLEDGIEDKIVHDLGAMLTRVTGSKVDAIYSDLIGRLITDLNHYKYMLASYFDPVGNNTLRDLKDYCKTPSQRKLFNELVRSFVTNAIVIFNDNSVDLNFNGDIINFDSIGKLYNFIKKNKIKQLNPEYVMPNYGPAPFTIYIEKDNIRATVNEEGRIIEAWEFKSIKDLLDNMDFNRSRIEKIYCL